MIDEDRTTQLYGYTSDELSPNSGKPVVMICDECGTYRVGAKHNYRDMCKSCAQTGKKMPPRTKEHSRKISDKHRGMRKRNHPPRTEEQRQHSSAGRQGISVEEWEGYSSDEIYCHKFDASCRERNRNKYGRVCFLCDKDEINNGRKLSVHHVDMNKDQGCNEHDWSLVPLCASCHGKAHNPTWQARIEYLLSSDKQ